MDSDGPIFQDDSVKLVCKMRYFYATKEGNTPPDAGISASIGWDSPPDGVPGSSTSENVTNEDHKVVGAALRAVVTTVAKGSTIPKYNCTTVFGFTNPNSNNPLTTYALNSLSWTCSSEAVPIWRKSSPNYVNS